MLEIQNLHASVDGNPILNGIDLSVKAGEVHAIMGPNGSGKSTLGKVLAGLEDYEVTQGSIQYAGQDLLELSVEERAQQGIFLGFQYPVEVPGVSNTYFLKTALNAHMKLLEMDNRYKKRFVNVGFSGGEKKRNEILQMALLEPKMCILDETDSGLDVDAMKLVSQGVNALRDAGRGFLVITHYQRLLDHIQPDVVHIMSDGRIVKTGGPELALEVEQNGYADILEEVA